MKKNPLNTIPSFSSEAEVWKEFHKALDDVFGTEKGNEIWMSYWTNRGNKSAMNADLLQYLEKEGITVDAPLVARISAGAQEAFTKAKNRLSSIFKFSFGGSMIIGIVVLILVLKLINNIIKDPNKYASAVGSVSKTVATKGIS